VGLAEDELDRVPVVVLDGGVEARTVVVAIIRRATGVGASVQRGRVAVSDDISIVGQEGDVVR
jgi:hypothetical protein